jgi:hypothetical protein
VDLVGGDIVLPVQERDAEGVVGHIDLEEQKHVEDGVDERLPPLQCSR